MTTRFEVLEGVLRVNTAGWRAGFRGAERVARGFTQKVVRGFDMATAAANRTIKATARVGKNLAASGAQLAAVGVGVGAVSSKIAASFEQSMARVEALTGEGRGTAAFIQMENAAKRMGETTEFSARQAADAMQFFGLAGFKANEIVGALPDTLKLASAGKLEIAQAADISAKVMKGMGLEVKDLGAVTDVLTKAFTTSNTDLVQLGEAFKKVGPVANAAGINLTDTAAAVQKLSDAGIQGEAAGAALRNIYAKLAGNAKSVRDIMEPLGVSLRNVDGSMRPLPDVIDDFNTAIAKSGREGERAGMVMEAFGLRAGPAMAVLLESGGAALRQASKDLHDPGVAARIAATQLDTLKGSVTILKSGLEGLAISIGQKINPRIRQNVEATTRWIQANRQLLVGGFLKFWDTLSLVIDETVESIFRLWKISTPARDALSGLTAEAKGLYEQLAAVFGSMPEWLQDLIKVSAAFAGAAFGVSQLSTMIPILGTVLRALFVTLGPIGWALLVIGTVAGIVMKNWESIVAYAKEKFGPQLEWIAKVAELVRDRFRSAMSKASRSISIALAFIVSRIALFWKKIKPYAVEFWQTSVSLIRAVFAAIRELFSRVGASLARFFKDSEGRAISFGQMMESAAEFITKAWLKLASLWNVFNEHILPVLVELGAQLFDVFMEVGKEVLDMLFYAFTDVKDAVVSLLVEFGILNEQGEESTDMMTQFSDGLKVATDVLVKMVRWAGFAARVLVVVLGAAFKTLANAAYLLLEAIKAIFTNDFSQAKKIRERFEEIFATAAKRINEAWKDATEERSRFEVEKAKETARKVTEVQVEEDKGRAVERRRIAARTGALRARAEREAYRAGMMAKGRASGGSGKAAATEGTPAFAGEDKPNLPDAPAVVESFAQMSQAVASSGEELRTKFTDSVSRMFAHVSRGANQSASDAKRFFASLSRDANEHSRILISKLEKHLAKSGQKLTASQRRQVVSNRRQLTSVLRQMQSATGDQKKALAAKAIEIERDMRLMFIRVKIAGSKAWEDMTEAQRGELAKQKANLDKEAEQMIAALGEFKRKLAENAPGAARGRAGGGGLFGGFQQAGQRAFASIDQNIRDTVQGMARFSNVLQTTADPAERLRLLIGKAQGELGMFVHNASLLEAGMRRSWRPLETLEAIERQRLLIGEKRLQIQRMENQLQQIMEERERRRLAAFRAYQSTLQQQERRRAEDRELFGPQTQQFTGTNRPIDIGGQRPGIAAGAGAGGARVTENRSVVVYNQFNEEITPDRAREIADALESEMGNRGVDISGQSSLRGVN